MSEILVRYGPVTVLLVVWMVFMIRLKKPGEQSQEMQARQLEVIEESNQMAKETLDLMRRQVAALEAIAKKP